MLVPVKSFSQAKRRLQGFLSETDRRKLSMRMATQVLRAASPLPTAVVCDDREVADWARQQGALVIWEPGRGLNGAVEAGVHRLTSMGVDFALVAHSDLPLPAGLPGLAPFNGVTLVPDSRQEGTNVIRLPTRCDFRFSYGPGSFERHRAVCRRAGLAFRVVHHPELAVDVDSPIDLWADRRWSHLTRDIVPLAPPPMTR